MRTLQWGIENGLPANPENNSVHTNVRGNKFIWVVDAENPAGSWHQYWDDTVVTAPSPVKPTEAKLPFSYYMPILITAGLCMVLVGFAKNRLS